MSLQDSVKNTVKEFEKSLPAIQRKKLEFVHKKFENMVSKGLINPPSYDLESISTIFTDISRL